MAVDKEHLQAIHDAPLDDAPRRAYAQALRNGDPRAELIALQLGDGDPLRERALIAKHGKEWSGKIGALFRHHVYRGGFFAGGTLKASKLPSLKDPAWKLVQVLGKDWPPHRPDIVELIDAPELVAVRGVYELWSGDAAQIATGPRRHLTELGVHESPPEKYVDALATCPSLPELTTLGIRLDDNTHSWLTRAPILQRIRRLIVDNAKGLSEIVAACAQLGGPLREIVVSAGYDGPLFSAPGWRLRILRDAAPGPFTRVIGSYAPRTGGYPGFSLGPLGALDPRTIASIDLVANKIKMRPDERVFVKELLSRFAHVHVPW